MSLIAFASMSFFVAYAITVLRNLRRAVYGLKRHVTIMETIIMGEHVRNNFEQLNEMKETFTRLVEDERFEEAERLKAAIANAERNAKAALKHFKDVCGDNLCEVIVTKAKNHISEED
jgi:uncharacterized protein YqgV (UPF0045/DUF77 family)